jgi:hypothetical protein
MEIYVKLGGYETYEYNQALNNYDTEFVFKKDLKIVIELFESTAPKEYLETIAQVRKSIVYVWVKKNYNANDVLNKTYTYKKWWQFWK